jgi:hypothetical protein
MYPLEKAVTDLVLLGIEYAITGIVWAVEAFIRLLMNLTNAYLKFRGYHGHTGYVPEPEEYVDPLEALDNAVAYYMMFPEELGVEIVGENGTVRTLSETGAELS